MTPDDLHHLGNTLSTIRPGTLIHALEESPEEDRQAVLRLLQRAQMVDDVRSLANPLRGLWSGAEERRHEREQGR